MEKIDDLDELILSGDFQESLLRKTMDQQASLTENLETQKMCLQELQKPKVRFPDLTSSTDSQCEILSLKKFRKLNEILAAKDIIIQ